MNKRQRKKHNQKLAHIYYTNKIQKALYEFLKGQEKVPCTSEGIEKIKEVILDALNPYPYTIEIEELTDDDRKNRRVPKINILYPIDSVYISGEISK